jgi:plastocyanin
MNPYKRQLSFHKRRLLFLPVLLVLLGALPLVQGMAGGAESTPTVTAVEGGGIYGEPHSWSPVQTMIANGGAVAFSNNSTVVNHGIEWIGAGPKPTCTAGVPVGTTAAASGTNWSGTCTFAQAGVYTFYCTVHGPEMTGRVVVGATGITTISQTTTQSSSTGGGTTTTTTTTSGASPTEGSPGSPLVGSAAKAVKLAKVQHGRFVRGSVDVAAGGAGGKLEIELLAKQRVGLLHASLTTGIVSFKVPLSAKAKRTLSKHRRLALTVKLILTPKQGSVVTITRHIVQHA